MVNCPSETLNFEKLQLKEMDGEMEDFSSIECVDALEIDWEYEFDAAGFYDFCRPESPSEAEEAQRWFQTAGYYPPSPHIVKLNLGKEYSGGPLRLPEEKATKSISSNSNIHISKSKTEGILSDGRMYSGVPKAKAKPEPSCSKARGSTLMKPTASHLAKQRSHEKPPRETRSSWNSSASYILATKRQKLESGYLRKVTVPREPRLETMQRAQRRRTKNDSETNDHAKAKAQTSKARILTAHVLPSRPKTMERTLHCSLPPLPKTMERTFQRSSGISWKLSNSQNTESASNSTSADIKRPNTQNAVKQGESLPLLKSKVESYNKILPSEDTRKCQIAGERSKTSPDSQSIVEKKLPVHPPIELFSKLSIRSKKETSIVSQQKIHAS